MLLFFYFSCSNPERIQVIIGDEPLFQSLSVFVDTMDEKDILLSQKSDALHSDAYHVYVFQEDLARENYQLSKKGKDIEILGGDVLGVQYGLAHYLELQGFRFFHPYETRKPSELHDVYEEEVFDRVHAPQMERRGIHLHTLHPIEGYYDFWEGEELERAQKVGSWVIKNRGNYIQWVALDDITDNPLLLTPWQENTASIVENLHKQGLEVGLGIQIYGSGNLQNAYDLIDQPNGAIEEQLTERLTPILEGTNFDLLELSFGEFFGEDPENFIQTLDKTYDVARSLDSDIEISARIHVGADLQITYQEEEMIYYFLAQYANPDIVPWVHTVMYYNLFEEANGAYHHEYFDEHREFLFARLRDGLPVAYFPESAYWVAFDNSVPTYLPLYIRSRWVDLMNIQKEASEKGYDSLQQHILFSSGWEWGYWQNDVATLRMNWNLEDSYLHTLEEMFSPYQDQTNVAQVVFDLAEIQHRYLIEEKLDRYMCGVDNIMEIGYGAGIISQPPRESFSQMYEGDPQQLTSTADKLRAFAQEQEVYQERLAIAAADRWIREIQDGLAITILRARFMASLLTAIAERSEDIKEAEEYMHTAKSIVEQRALEAHDPNMDRLITENDNATIYQFGYLYRAHELCYWERERIQVQNILQDGSEIPPGCGI